MKKPKRHYYILEPHSRESWILKTKSGSLVAWFGVNRKMAVNQASDRLDLFASIGQHSELQVRRMDGTIGETRTYPRSSDPRKSKG